ncbi:unnamed protein product [Calypogeia fissa]
MSTPIGPVQLVWVFPALHVMSYPSVAVKGSAMRLLQVVERAVAATAAGGLWKDEKQNVKGFATRNGGGFAMSLDSLEESTSCCWGGRHLSVAVWRLLQSMWSTEVISENWVSVMKADYGRKGTAGERWLRSLTAYLNKYNQHPRMVNPTSQSLGLNKDLLVSLCTLVTVCLLTPSAKITLTAAEALASIAKVEPIWGMSFLPVVLFCVRFRGKLEGLDASEVQLGLLKVFPALAGHSATLPLVLQALQPMLDSKTDSVYSAVQATGIRLLCRTWELSDRAFPHLQKMLRPGDINEAILQTDLAQSRAACVRDVSRKDPDRGVDLVLSVQACIESKDSVVVSLGLQSLALLCKEDLIDFYTAWLVISKLFPLLPSHPLVLESLCMLLRYGALDAAAHPDAAVGVLDILWKAAALQETREADDAYSGARAMAFEGLSFYEVDDLEVLCPDEKRHEVELLRSETSDLVLPFLEDLLIKALGHEHSVRQRGQKEVKVIVSKLGKLLKAFPGALNTTGFVKSSGKVVTSISDFPGATLLCLSLPAPEKTERVSKVEYQRQVKVWQTNYEKIFLEVADQLHFGRNLVVAMLSLQSWCSFVSRWLDAIFTRYETDSPNLGRNENLLKAAKYLSQIMKKSCEDGIPRVAESATLALAALCKVMPTQAHGVAQDISMFLEKRLLQEGHEYMQWSATLALGVVATCLHETDWSRKHNIVQLLLKHAGTSDRGIVRGACGLALGIISQSLLRQESSFQSAGTARKREVELLVQIILSLVQLTSEASPKAAPALGKFLGLLRTEVIANERVTTSPLPQAGPRLEEDSFWAVVGLVWGLGSSVTGLYQLHCATLVSALTDLMISWVSGYSDEHNDSTHGKKKWDVLDFFLAAGACLALSTCLEVSARLELLTQGVTVLLENAISLITNAVDPGNSSGMEHWKSSLICSLYVGSGNLLASVLQDGAQSIPLQLVQKILGHMEAGVESSDHNGWGQLGALIGIANSLGAGAVLLMPGNLGPNLAELHMLARVQVGGTEQSSISRPLLHEATCEDYVSTIIKKILGVVRNEQDSHLKGYAGWSLAFVHNGFFGGGEVEGKEEERVKDDKVSPNQAKLSFKQSGYHMRSLQDYPDESPLKQLCTMLMNHEQMDMVASVLRCLEKAPRLPALDWGGIVRREMRQNRPSLKGLAEVPQLGTPPIVREPKFSAAQEEVRQHCVLFALAHAEQIPALASFLDELCELSRLGTLEASIRNLLMRNIFNLQLIFSPLRLKQLLKDVQEYALNPTGLAGFLLEDKVEADSQRSSFRVSLWNGLALFFEDYNSGQPEESDSVVSFMENCMMVLISLLPSSIWRNDANRAEDDVHEANQVAEEWSVAITTLAKTSKSWLIQALEVQVSKAPGAQERFDSCSRAVFARSQLFGNGCLSITELKICRRWILSHRPSDVRTLLVELVWAVKDANLEDRREWLLDSLDTAFISPFPTTAIVLAALLTSCWSTMSPILPLNPVSAIQDFPLTLAAALSKDGWGSTSVDSVTNKLTLLVDRLGNSGSENEDKLWERIQFFDREVSVSDLSSVLRRTCVGLKQYLSPESKHNLVFSNLSDIVGFS